MEESNGQLHELFLSYPAEELLAPFVEVDAESEDPKRHLKRWQQRIADASVKDRAYLERDETLWTAGSLLAIHRCGNSRDRWRQVLESLFGPVPTTSERLE